MNKIGGGEAQISALGSTRSYIARADALWGYTRESSGGGAIWADLLPARVALGEFDAACAKAKVLVENPSFNPAQVLWLDRRIGELHKHECFRTLMRAHGADVENEPFAANRKAGAAL